MRRSILFVTWSFTFVAVLHVAAQQTKPVTQPSQDSSQTTKAAPKLDYPLTPKCGPWMVMVKSFRGPEAVEVANKLARELREKHKIAAYTTMKKPEEQPQVQQVGMVRGHVRQYLTACVLAGDCKDEKAAAKLKEQIQKIKPSSITEDMIPNYQWELHNAHTSVRTPGSSNDMKSKYPSGSEDPASKYQWQVGPLRTAFCLPNPLLPPVPLKPDPVLVKVNSGKNSIFNCTGDYTLEAILFTGGVAVTEPEAKKLEKHSVLEAAGEHAEMICTFLRERGFDAYTYHALTYSVVAVGSFDSPADPQIPQLAQKIAGMQIAKTNFFLVQNPTIMKVPHKR